MSEAIIISDLKDRNGSLRITVEGSVLIAQFTGACSVRLGKAFKQSILKAKPFLPSDGWAYLSSSTDYLAALPEVEALYTQTYQLCMENGCIIEAYCMPSAMGLAQVDKSRKACGVESSIKDLAFDSIDDAKYFLISTLEHIKSKRSANANQNNHSDA